MLLQTCKIFLSNKLSLAYDIQIWLSYLKFHSGATNINTLTLHINNPLKKGFKKKCFLKLDPRSFGAGYQNQCFANARQAIYKLSYIPSPLDHFYLCSQYHRCLKTH
jgi:hypothetical protein